MTNPLTLRCRPLLWIAAAACISFSAAHAQTAGTLAQLYAARPPAEMAYVRVVSREAHSVRIQIAQAPEETLSPRRVASNYAIVTGHQVFNLRFNGQPSGQLQVAPGSYTTLLLQPQGQQASWLPITDAADAPDALKASLHFYNLLPGCESAQLQVAPDGPALFRAVPAQTVQSRAINPVAAQLQGSCQAASSAALQLPLLQPADHYSIFLLGTLAQPVLHGQPNTTNPYRP